MSESKHTRGPLVAHKQPDGDIIDHAYSILTHGDECRCVALINLDAGTFADLQLWASAPDLLEALKELVGMYRGVCSNLPFGVTSDRETERDLAKTLAVVAKAEGRDE